jgi:integrase/recombinase XerD
MLEDYFVRPETADHIRASWIWPQIEEYAAWLEGRGCRPSTVARRFTLLAQFGDWAWAHGARAAGDLPGQVEPFIAHVLRTRSSRRRGKARRARDGEYRRPVQEMLTVTVPGYAAGAAAGAVPFAVAVPGYFAYLENERGLRPATVDLYRHCLGGFEAWLARTGAGDVAGLSAALLSSFIAERSGTGLSKGALHTVCAALRSFLRYAHREGRTAGDLSAAVEGPQIYRLAGVPRSVSWAEVGQVLAAVDRRTACGRRDYAILMLIATYGLRAREVAALRLDDIDWKRGRLSLPARKAGHAGAFPLSATAGQALADYLSAGRPQTTRREVFFQVRAPLRPVRASTVAGIARTRLVRAGVSVPRPGSHTLRHSAIQHLVDSGFAAKTVADYAGHRSAESTRVYVKAAVGQLREVALGHGEEVLG